LFNVQKQYLSLNLYLMLY